MQENNSVSPYGKHLIIDAYGIKETKLQDGKSIKQLLNFLPEYMDMHKLRNAVLHKVESDDYNSWGLSGFVLLLESHISCHTWPEIGYVSMDVYSCRNFDHGKVMNYLKEFWDFDKATIKVVKRSQNA